MIGAEATFQELMQRVRERDAEAAAELVRRYERHIRRAVRFQLVDPRLRRLFDSMDVCQSVLASFFTRAAAGQYELDSPEQLVKLLVTMARNQLVSAARRQCSQRSDHRRIAAAAAERLHEITSRESSPSQKRASRELLSRFRQQLNDEERQIA